MKENWIEGGKLMFLGFDVKKNHFMKKIDVG